MELSRADVSFRPALTTTLSADRSAVLPGDDIALTARVGNAGGPLTVTGTVKATNPSSASITVVDWYQTVEFRDPASGNWVPLAGYQNTASGVVPREPAPSTSGLDVQASPRKGSGVGYPPGGDRVLGTSIGAGRTAQWSVTAKATLTGPQLKALANPRRSDHLRVVVHLEPGGRKRDRLEPGTEQASVDNPAPRSRAAATNVALTVTLPNGAVRTVAGSQVPGLKKLTPGALVEVPLSYRVPAPAPVGKDEADQQYLARLSALEGALLRASAVTSADLGDGDDDDDDVILPPPANVSVIEHLPVVTIAKSGPTVLDAGDTGAYSIRLGNRGGADATGLRVTDTVPDGAHGTVSDVPSSLSPEGAATSTAKFTVPAGQPAGPLADRATVRWKDANRNEYGPVSSVFETVISSSVSGATLTLEPAAAGPNLVGTSQTLTVTLTDRRGAPVSGASVRVSVTGANRATSTVTTGSDGTAEFRYSGSGAGTDTVQAEATVGSRTVQSGTAQVSWVEPVAPVSMLPVRGRFFAELQGTATFVATPADVPDFEQSFPAITFNPPASALHHNATGVDTTTRPFTDVTLDPAGNGVGAIPAQGNGKAAGTGPMTAFDAVFTSTLQIAAAGDVTFRLDYDSGFLFGIGGGATRVSGRYENPPPDNLSVFERYPLVGADNTEAGAPRSTTVTVHFPAPGSYPFEIDYFDAGGSALSLVLSTESVTQDTSGLAVYVGYADGLRPGGSLFPFPWAGSPGTVFVGCTGSCLFDAGAVRFDNTSGDPITINSLAVQVGDCRFAIWPADTVVPDGEIAMFTQTVSGAEAGCVTDGTFDTSDAPSITCTPTGLIPHITAVIDGVTHEFDDADQVLNTKGLDGACVGNENQAWSRVGGNGREIRTPLPPAAHLVLTPLSAAGSATPTSIDGPAGSAQTFRLSVTDASGLPADNVPADLTLTGGNGSVQHLTARTGPDGTALLSYTPTTAGTLNLQAAVLLAGLRTQSNQLTLVVSEPPGVEPDPANPGQTLPALPPVITTPSIDDGTVLTEPTTVHATITPPAGETVTSWSVTVRPAAGGREQTLAQGTGAPPATLATLDPTVLSNGTYLLAISAVSSNGGTQTSSTTVAVRGDLKPGRYRATFRDLSVPVNGIPLQVDRTYDSIDLTSGDFGPGWTVAVGGFKVAANRAIGAGGWSSHPTRCVLTFCLFEYTSSTPHFVTVTFPDTHQEVFDFTPQAGAFLDYFQGTAAFTARRGTGTTSTLEALDDALTFDFAGNLQGSLGETYQPTRYRLTTKDGQIFILDTGTGLVSQTDPAGNTVSVGRDGVQSSNGQSLSFARDGQDRITTITDPAGRTYRYGYSAAGDLDTYTDALGTVIRYGYDDTHHLTSISGPTQAQPLQQLNYDDTGRLVSVTDAEGRTVPITHDVTGRKETLRDPLGRLTTVLTLDELGDVVRKDEIADGVTRTSTYTYDDAGRQTSATDPNGATARAAYDETGNLTTYTAVDGRTLTLTYDDRGNPLTWTQPGGATTTFTYDAHNNLLTTTDPLGRTSASTYDPAGREQSHTDPAGFTTQFGYDAQGRMTTRTDPLGRTTLLGYDDANRAVTATDPAGNLNRLGYDDADNLTSAVDGLGRTTSIGYDALGRPTSSTDPTGAVTRHQYDGLGHLTRTTDPLGRITTRSYDADGHQVSQTAPDGAVTRYTYDGFGQLTTSTDPLGNQTRYSYDPVGHLATTTAADGGVTRYQRDEAGRPVKVTDPLGRATTYTYDPDGRLARATDPAGAVTRYTYDAAGNLVTATDPNGHAHTYRWDANDQLLNDTDPLGHATSYGYNPAGQLVEVTDPTGRTSTTSYDAAGNLASNTDPAGHQTTYQHDAAGQITALTLPSGLTFHLDYDQAGRVTTASDPLGHTTAVGYDAAGQQTTHTDPMGHITRYQYDPAGRLTTITDPLGGHAGFGYDTDGRLTTLTDPVGHATTLGYDPTGRQTSRTVPGGGVQRSSYDLAGQLSTWTNARGQNASFDYDTAGRLASITHPGGRDTFTYDTAGRRLTATGPTGTVGFTWDDADRLTGTTSPQGNVNYSYDAAGRRTGITQPHGRSAQYSYDTAGLLSAVTSAGKTTDYQRDADGRLTGQTRPNGVASTYGYDAAGRLTSIDHQKGSTTLDSYQYTLDANGNRTAMTGPQGSENYTLDANQRLTAVTYPDGEADQYTYDAAGDRLSLTASGAGAPGTTAYGYDTDGRLTSAGATTYGYDADGNVTAAGSAVNSYDWAGRLTGSSSGGTATSYGYDADGLRTTRTSGGNTAEFAWDRALDIPQVLDDGSTGYLRTPDGSLLAETGTGGLTYPLSDALGSVRLLTDDTGAVSGTSGYDVFGAAREATGSIGASGFAGELTDPNGLTYLRARFLDPSTGRFLSPDPALLGAEGTAGFNRYSYARNNAVNVIDPTGKTSLSETSLVMSIGSGILNAVVSVAIGSFFCPVGAEYTNCLLRQAFLGFVTGLIGSLLGTVGGGLIAGLGGVGSRLLAHCALGVGEGAISGALDAAWRGHFDPSSFAENTALGCGLSLLAYGLAPHSERLLASILKHFGIRVPRLSGGTPPEGGASPARPPSAPDGPNSAPKPIASDEQLVWPPNRGFLHDPEPTTLKPGARIDRYGREGGTFASPEGTPFAQRSLPSQSATEPYQVYEVVGELEVREGIVAPWFGQPGLGTQYELPSSVADLVSRGYLKRVE